MSTRPPWHYADRHLSLGLVLVIALLAGAALTWVSVSSKKGGKR